MDQQRLTPADRRFAAAIIQTITSEENYGTPYCDRCVDFLDVVRAMTTLSHGPHQWSCHLSRDLDLPNCARTSTRYLLIAYSNPDQTGLPNHLCFCVPIIVRQRRDRDKPYMVACFDASAVRALSPGLYWRDGELFEDYWEDFERFYYPLAKLFWDKEKHGEQGTEVNDSEVDPQPDQLTMEGITYRQSITALLWRWILAPTEISKRIDPLYPRKASAADKGE